MSNSFNPFIIPFKNESEIIIKKSSTSNINLSKYKYIFNKSKSVILHNIYDYYYFRYILCKINLKELLSKRKNNILLLYSNIYNKNQFTDAIYSLKHNCNSFYLYENFLDKLKSTTYINELFTKEKSDYIFIPNLFYKYSNISLQEYQFNQQFAKIILLIFIYQNINGCATLILPEITNDVSIELLYLLSQFYKKIHFCTKSMEEITCGQYNIRIVTCKFFKGIDLSDICKIVSIIQQWEKIDTSNGFLLNKTINNNSNDNHLFPYNNQNHSFFVKQLFKWKNPIPDTFKSQIKLIHLYFKKQQLFKFNNEERIYNIINSDKLNTYQLNYAIKWCETMNIDIDPFYNIYWNYNSSHDEKIIKINKNRLKYLFPKKENVKMEQLQISSIGDYSITPSSEAYKMAKLLHNILKDNQESITITDSTCGNAGNAIQFAYFFSHVNAVELSKQHFDICKNNIDIYKLKNVTMINDDYLNIMTTLKQDIIFIDPPWGGPTYKEYNKIPLYLGKQRIEQIISDIMRLNLAKIIGVKIPYNFDLHTFYETIHYKYISIINFNKCKLIIIKIENI